MEKFLHNEKDLFLKFIRESKLLIGAILFFLLLSYGIKLTYYSFSIDTEFILTNYHQQLGAWKSIGRIGLVLTKSLLFLEKFNPYVANFLTYFTFAVACILLSYLLQRILQEHRKPVAIMIVPILFLTHPIFAEQFNFILQSFEVALAILFLVIALLSCFYFIETNFYRFLLVWLLF